MRWLIDYAAKQSSRIFAWQHDTEHMEKAFVFAGMLAQRHHRYIVRSLGLGRYRRYPLGCRQFFLAYSPKADPDGLIEKLVERYEVTRRNIKNGA